MDINLQRKEVLKELYKFDLVDKVSLEIYQKGLIVSFTLFTFEAIKLVQMLPNNSTFYHVQKSSFMAQ